MGSDRIILFALLTRVFAADRPNKEDTGGTLARKNPH